MFARCEMLYDDTSESYSVYDIKITIIRHSLQGLKRFHPQKENKKGTKKK